MSRPLDLSLALSSNPRTEPVHNGSAVAAGINLHVIRLHPSEMFWRQLRFREFDISEMSISSLMIATSRGDNSWIALPVFTSRDFYHARVLVRTDADIRVPGDLVGKRVGVPEYQQTAALWARGVLRHEFGVDPRDLHWFMERPPERSHGGAMAFAPPAGIDLEYLPRETNIGELLVSGDLDASLVYLSAKNLIDRSQRGLGSDEPRVRPLFEDPVAESTRYFRKTGFFPVNHCVVLRRETVERHPWVPLNIYAMFLEAKQTADDFTEVALKPLHDTGVIEAGPTGATSDLFAYGVRDQRALLETMAGYAFEQGLTGRKVEVDELFYPATLDL